MNNNTLSNISIPDNRIQSIDILRGLLIILMALDHVRDYFMFNTFAFSATDPELTTLGLYATRWITHLCAPGFIWLTGISAFIYYTKNGVQKTSGYLFSRGLILIFLEFTVIKLAWHFKIDYSFLVLLVIWAIGASMVLLAAACWLKQEAVFIIGIVIIAFHNLFDSVAFQNKTLSLIWNILHQTGSSDILGGVEIKVLYPILPMFGLICLGFGMGSLFTKESLEIRKSILQRVSLILLLVFISIRTINEYGDPNPWVHNQYLYRTVFSFLDVTKYPMSLDYMLIMLSILFFLFVQIETKSLALYRPLALFGKVSMFFYVIHLFVIHALAIGSHFVINDFQMDWNAIDIYEITFKYGFSLPVVYIIWLSILILLYPICKKYRTLKSQYPNSFLKFI